LKKNHQHHDQEDEVNEVSLPKDIFLDVHFYSLSVLIRITFVSF
jgi:hypothetical protein